MKSAWTYSGFSHHSVPSLSNVAIRSEGGTKSGPPSVVTRSTKWRIAARVGVSFQLASWSATSVAGKRHLGFLGEIGERLAADVDHRFVDRPADEWVGVLAWVVVGDGLGGVLADVQALACQRKVPRLRLDASLADSLVSDVKRERSLGRHRVALPRKRRRDDNVAGRDRFR